MDNLRAQLKTIQLVYFAVLGSALIFTTIVYVLLRNGVLGPPDYSIAVPLQNIALLLIPSSMAAAYFVFRMLVSRIPADLPTADKFKKYAPAVLIRAALLEVPFLFCVVATVITREQLFLTVTPLIFFAFMMLRPTAESMASDLNLSAFEKEKLGVG